MYFWQLHTCIQYILIIFPLNPSPHSSWTFSTPSPTFMSFFLFSNSCLHEHGLESSIGAQYSTSGHTPKEKWLPQCPIASNLGWGLMTVYPCKNVDWLNLVSCSGNHKCCEFMSPNTCAMFQRQQSMALLPICWLLQSFYIWCSCWYGCLF